MNVTRRTLLLAGLLPVPVAAADALAALERRAGGRLGVALLDTGSGRRWVHRGDERFGLCSTFKLPLAGAVLQAVDQGRLRADARLPLRRSERVPHMPATEAWLARGWATPLALAEAAQVTSDNLAANVLLRALGGPEAFTGWLRAQGDPVTRIDRYEPALNRVLPGDARDTSSPAALAGTVARLCAGDTLQAASRDRLIAWMVATQTGRNRLRAGLPAAWRAGDKTGTGFSPGLPDRLNDVAVFWPPGRQPWVLACFYEGPAQSTTWVRPQDEAVLAEVGRLAADFARGA
ncbi:class A beta-lactamase [Rubrivivax sp. RP6-9]|uniref:class A beta-lactamase n=1 Tax=Rubrivivax sp. RP6-9 TaxID=3415750 RepID=UPI003CC6506F